MLHIIENFAVALWWVDSFAVASLSGCLRVLSLNRRYLSGVTAGAEHVQVSLEGFVFLLGSKCDAETVVVGIYPMFNITVDSIRG